LLYDLSKIKKIFPPFHGSTTVFIGLAAGIQFSFIMAFIIASTVLQAAGGVNLGFQGYIRGLWKN
jgi:hypothetical protein